MTKKLAVNVHVESDLVKQIADLHEEANLLAERAVERAIRVGELLSSIRLRFPKRAAKGQGFEQWVEDNLPFGGRMARNYIRAFENKDQLNLGGTLRDNLQRLATSKPIPETGYRNDEAGEADALPADGKVHATWTAAEEDIVLESKDEKKALELAQFFGVDANKARSWVLSKKKPTKAAKPKKQDKNKLVPVTIRFEPVDVEVMEQVARNETKKQGRVVSLAEVAREHHKLGAVRFANKYGIRTKG